MTTWAARAVGTALVRAAVISKSVTATAAAAALAIALVACGGDGGDEGTRTPVQEPGAPVGKPLPPEIVGSWYEQAQDDDTKWRTSFLAAGHELCLEVVGTRGNCYFGEAASGGAVLEADDLGQPRMGAFGEVGVNGEELVFRLVQSPDDECEGSRHSAAWRVRGERLLLEPTSRECGVERARPIRLDRAG